MKVFITGATGYIGSAVARTMHAQGHSVTGFVRSETSARQLNKTGFESVVGDFSDLSSVLHAIDAVSPDVIISTASIIRNDREDFSGSGHTVKGIASHLAGSGKTLVFTSGSAAFGVLADGKKSEKRYSEDFPLPLSADEAFLTSEKVSKEVVDGFISAMTARAQAEQAVRTTPGIRGIVIRPGNVWGHGGSIDLPAQIEMAKRVGFVPFLGSGSTLQSFVHVDSLAELFALAIKSGKHGDVFHGASEEVSQSDITSAIARMLGGETEARSVDFEKIKELAGGIWMGLSLNKRLDATCTRSSLGWHSDILGVLHDIEFGSYNTGL